MRTRLFPSTFGARGAMPERPRPVVELVRRFLRHLRRLRYSPALHWCAAALLALATMTTTVGRHRELDRRMASLGPTVRVAVTAEALPAGGLVDASSIRWRSVPRGLVPTDALRRLGGEHRVAVDHAPGEVLRRGRLRGGGGSATAAAVPEGALALSVPLPPALRPAPGDVVELLAIDEDGMSAPIALDARVVSRRDGAAVVAVPRRRAGVVADAVLAGTLTVALAAP